MSVHIPYGRQSIDESDVAAVTETLRSDWLTQGPKVAEFEAALAAYCGARHAVAFANGTAALQGAYFAAGFKPGDEFITSPITFAATATAGLWQGAKPVFADVDPATGNLDPKAAEKLLTARTRAVVVAGTGELAYGRDRLPDAARWFQEDPAALGAMADRLKAEDPSRPVLLLAKTANWKQLSASERSRWEEVTRNSAAVVARRR